jgi:hypothetical protein
MIPEFTSNGWLPPGIYVASWSEFVERFAVFKRSNQRMAVIRSMEALYLEAKKSGIVKRFLVAGSLLSVKDEPNDFDCILVLDEKILTYRLPPFQYNLASRRMARRLFKGDVVPVLEGSVALQNYLDFFQMNREGQRIGLVEIQL